MDITVGISNRHVHVTKETLEILFGKDYQLQELKPINQPGQYASTDCVTIQTEKGTIENVRILGPTRKYNQVEISKTDAFKLGVNPPIRESGDLEGSSPITIIGPKGSISLEEGCIIADRHIHITPSQVKEYGLENITEVSVLIDGIKGGTLNHVRLKVDEASYFEIHLDTDDANAHLLKNGDIVHIIK